jgi:hypothetical protein
VFVVPIVLSAISAVLRQQGVGGSFPLLDMTFFEARKLIVIAGMIPV